MSLIEIFSELSQYFECMKDLPPRAIASWCRELEDLSDNQIELMLDNVYVLPRSASIHPRRLKLLALDAPNTIEASWRYTLDCQQADDIYRLAEDPLAYSVAKTIGIVNQWRFWEQWQLLKLHEDYCKTAEEYLLGEKPLLPISEHLKEPPKALPPANLMTFEEFKQKKAAYIEKMKDKLRERSQENKSVGSLRSSNPLLTAIRIAKSLGIEGELDQGQQEEDLPF